MLTTLTINGCTVETTDSDLVVRLLSGSVASVEPKARVAKPKVSKRVSKPKASGKADLLKEIRAAVKVGDFAKAEGLVPSGWVQVAAEVARAAKIAQEPKAAQESCEVVKPKRRSTRQPKADAVKEPKAPKVVAVGTEGPAVTAVKSSDGDLTEWKLRFQTKVNDVLAGGDGDEIACAYAELMSLRDACDSEADLDPLKAGKMIAKAAFLSDLLGRLTGEEVKA